MSAGLSVAQWIAALQRKSVPIPFEIGAFLVLEASERAVEDPVVVNASELRVSDEGELIMPQRTPGSHPTSREVCKALGGLLGELLVCSAQSVPPMLLRLVESGPDEAPSSPAELRDELKATLVPLNRAAMRRVLARLVREARRDVEDARPRLSLHPQPTDQEHELDAILAGRTVEPSRDLALEEERTATGAEDDGAELDAVLDGLERKPAQARPAEQQPREAAPAGAAVPPSNPAQVHPPADSPRPRPRLALGDQGDSLDRFEHAASVPPSAGARLGWAALLATTALVALALWLGRERTRSLVGLEDAPAALAPAAPTRATTRQYGVLTVTSNPPRAQVLMHVGKAPAIASKLPVGVVHEFVALHSGFGAGRALVPADAQWKPQEGELRYELALQLRETSKGGREDELGAAKLPDSLGTPAGALGSVRVVTSPPGADVYQLIGFTPDVKLENLPTHEPLELLVYRPDYDLKRMSVGPGDWKSQSGQNRADLDVTLLKRSAGRERP